MIVAAPVLVEVYAVLPRLPPPHRLSPQTALERVFNSRARCSLFCNNYLEENQSG
jgi:hypothetical protein